MEFIQYNQVKNGIGGGIDAILNGGAGSGNFGHGGRPGKVGGSSSGGAIGSGKPSSDSRDGYGKYGSKDMKEARKTAMDYILKRSMPGNEEETSAKVGYGYDELGKPVRRSRFEKSSDDKIWGATAAMAKAVDSDDGADVTASGSTMAFRTLKLATAAIAKSQEYYSPSESKAASESSKKFKESVKKEIKSLKTSLSAETKKYGDTEIRKATRKALDDISSAMDGFIGFDKSSREYKD